MKIVFSSSRNIILIIVFVFLIAYSLYQARFLIFGPEIKIFYPKDGEVVIDRIVVMEGLAKNISWISLNDRQIFTDEKGQWSEKLIVSPGTSIMTVKVRDRFGRAREKSIHIILK